MIKRNKGENPEQDRSDRSCAEAQKFVTGYVSSISGKIPVVAAKLAFQDRLGHWKARLGIGRMDYKVIPGLYAVGTPDPRSSVFVSANYKLSFDQLRKELAGINAWILVLDTAGINVWCAAGKGTFGTEEIVRRVAEAGLSRVVSHRTLIVPQLGAPGVAAHKVKDRAGFGVVFGPVLASDIPAFLGNGRKATPEMRRVRFTLRDRLALTPIEVSTVLRHPAFLAVAGLYLLNRLGLKWLEVDLVSVLGAILMGTVVFPILLPYLPFRPFALNGWLLGMAWALGVNTFQGFLFSGPPRWRQALITCLLLPAISSFLAMNFTGSSTYTSLSGVLKEMKYAVPLIVLSFGSGLALIFIKI